MVVGFRDCGAHSFHVAACCWLLRPSWRSRALVQGSHVTPKWVMWSQRKLQKLALASSMLQDLKKNQDGSGFWRAHHHLLRSSQTSRDRFLSYIASVSCMGLMPFDTQNPTPKRLEMVCISQILPSRGFLKFGGPQGQWVSVLKWRFPEMGVPPNHPFLGYPHLWKPPNGEKWCNVGHFGGAAMT